MQDTSSRLWNGSKMSAHTVLTESPLGMDPDPVIARGMRAGVFPKDYRIRLAKQTFVRVA